MAVGIGCRGDVLVVEAASEKNIGGERAWRMPANGRGAGFYGSNRQDELI